MKLDDKTIDIVLPYVNPMDKSWQADFKKYKALAGDKGDNRFRDAGTLRHWFRLVRKNVKFKGYVHPKCCSGRKMPIFA